jgi:hypothetical protein
MHARSLRWGSLVVAAGLALALGGCRRTRPTPPPAAAQPGTGAPTITVEPAACTYARDNKNHWLQLRVTVANPSAAPVAVQWHQLLAAAPDGPLAGPTWRGDVLTPMLGPGRSVTAPVSWSYLGGPHPTPATVRLSYAPTGFAQVVPVKEIPTSGFSLRLGPAATAVLAANPAPMPGQSWEVRAPIEIKNPTPGPLMLVPYWFEAVAGDQRVRHAGNDPATLGGVVRLDAGETLRGSLLWRFRGVGPAPRRIRVTFPAGDKPELGQELDVKGPAQ